MFWIGPLDSSDLLMRRMQVGVFRADVHSFFCPESLKMFEYVTHTLFD